MRHRTSFRSEIVVGLATCTASILAFLHYYHRQEILLYGDAVAHINIARRVFDSLTPGPLQLGTVWLPLPHVLMMPFLVSNWMWRTGVGGSIISMAACVAGTLGIFRLVRVASEHHAWRLSAAAPWLAAAIYAGNPNLLYLQSTAMTEPLYLALFIWIILFFGEFAIARAGDSERAPQRLEGCAGLFAAAMLTRYDSWFLAGCIAIALAITWPRGTRNSHIPSPLLAAGSRRIRRAARNFVLLLAVMPALWLAYNYREFGNPLEFATGPYSARSIERRASTDHNLHYPGYRQPWVASLYFLKAAKLNLGLSSGQWPLLSAAVIGMLLTILRGRQFALWLWVPLPFYALSVAYGGVPIFNPSWWPFSYYNLRYGLELLPAVAVFAALAFALVARASDSRLWHSIVMVAAIFVVTGSYWSGWRNGPICLREARANGTTRQNFEIELAHYLESLPASARLLVSTGDHPGALEHAGIAFRRTINETSHPYWEHALAAPARAADYVIAFEDDYVARAVAVQPDALEPVLVMQLPHQPRTTIYKSLVRVR